MSKYVFRVSGDVQKIDFNRYFEDYDKTFEINGDFNTVGGWVLELFGRIPEVNEKVETDNLKITVESMKKRRIGMLKFEIKHRENSEG